MIEEKILAIVLYGALCLCIGVVIPKIASFEMFDLTLPNIKFNNPHLKSSWNILYVLAVTFAILLFWVSGLTAWSYLSTAMASVIVALVFKQVSWANIASAFVAFLISTSLLWWMPPGAGRFEFQNVSLVFSLVVSLIVVWGLNSNQSFRQKPLSVVEISVFLTTAIMSGVWIFNTGTTISNADATLWHHWSAYIGPAQTALAGAFPLHDFPLQYGLGPTLLLMIGGEKNIWLTMYWAAGITTGIMVCLLCWLTLILMQRLTTLKLVILMATMLLCTLLWTAYPPIVLATLATPSTTGLRFLPGVLFLTALIWNERRLVAIDSNISPPKWGHIIWLICILWSPEAGIHATAMWVPYMIWMSGKVAYASAGWKFILNALVELFLALICGLSLFAFGYWLTLGEWPLPEVYFSYMRNPPGAMPINPRGAIWFGLASLICWYLAWDDNRGSTDRANSSYLRCAWLVALLTVAVFSYYLGRSHDNNVLNLLPFIALLLSVAHSLAVTKVLQIFASVLLATLIGWVPNFGFQYINNALAHHQMLMYSPSDMLKSFSRQSDLGLFYLNPQAKAAKIHPEDASVALKSLRSEFPEPVDIIDMFLLLDQSEQFPPWNALHSQANYYYISSFERREYLVRASARIRSSGWVLYVPGVDAERYIADYDAVYNRTHEKEFGTYRAIRYVTK
jgi:hypothetical protein